ncbi:hypothetical protein [Streptomyces sp. NPDC007369]|uniref:hypothetical protein n=1 Tax=Streptomyces sp. NPDC007369 TaxID=3154589 RepID=UPI0033FA00BA
MRLTDTSTRRRKAQQMLALDDDLDDDQDDQDDQDADLDAGLEVDSDGGDVGLDGGDVITPSAVLDTRHHDVVRAARAGRYGEAAELAVIGERDDIRAHGINSSPALAWLSTRAVVAELSGSPETAAQLRATVIRMGGEVEWWHTDADVSSSQKDHREPLPVPAPAPDSARPVRARRRVWVPAAVIAALALATVGVWQQAETDSTAEERQQKAAAYTGKSGASLDVDGVKADVVARWTQDKSRVIVELSAPFEPDARYLRINGPEGKSAVSTRQDDRYTKPPQLDLPVSDSLADVTVQIEIGGQSWKEGTRGTVRSIRLSPSGVAYDADTGVQLPPK